MTRSPGKSATFFSDPSFQATPTPRFSSTGYGAYLRTKPPPEEVQAVPKDPLNFVDMAKENYNNKKQIKESYGYGCGVSCGDAGCSNSLDASAEHISNPVLEPGYMPGNYNEEANKVYRGSEYHEASSMIPIGDMTTTSPLGEQIQTVTYNNLMYANRRSRLRQNADLLRGDIIPVDHDGRMNSSLWRLSVNPSIDLESGALAVMGGVDNESNRALSAYMASGSGGTKTTFGGVDLVNSMDHQRSRNVSDVTVTAFP